MKSMRMAVGLTILAVAALVTATVMNSDGDEPLAQQKSVSVPESAQTLVVGGGCFWCVEPLFEMLKGVYHVEAAYAGGASKNVKYEQVLTGRTGHAEAVKVWFDPKTISADDLLRIFFTMHDPTTLNRQGADLGTQYRSVVFFSNKEEQQRAKRIIDEITKEEIWDDPIVTTIEALDVYIRAEEYHQDYYQKYEKASDAEREKMNSGYCTAVISPKVQKFKKKFDHLLKK